MKIAYVPSTFLPSIGGSETQIHNMANKTIELGNSVDIYLLKKLIMDIDLIKNMSYFFLIH